MFLSGANPRLTSMPPADALQESVDRPRRTSYVTVQIQQLHGKAVRTGSEDVDRR